LQTSIETTFDTVAQYYDHPALAFFDLMAEKVVDQVRLDSVSSLLDVATGTGKVALRVASQAPTIKVKGIDLSQGMLEQAHQKAQQMKLNNIEFEHMDMQTLQVPKHHFDVATCSAALFFFDDEDMIKTTQHIASKVKTGGKVIITAFDAGVFEPMNSILFKQYESYGYQLGTQDLPKLINDEQLHTLFSQAGLSHVNIQRNTYEAVLTSFDDWWHIVWNTSYRDMFTSMSEQQKITFKQEHQEKIQHLLKQSELSIKVGFAVASATVV